MALAIIISVLLVGPQGAPADVPKNHWAYPAVDRMFQEGLLKGYPKEPEFKLNKGERLDIHQAHKWLTGWAKAGLIPEEYQADPSGHSLDLSSPYLLAIYTYQALVRSIEELKRDISPNAKRIIFEELPNIARATSMLHTEITKLEGNPQWMIVKLNELRGRRFLGDR